MSGEVTETSNEGDVENRKNTTIRKDASDPETKQEEEKRNSVIAFCTEIKIH